MNELTKSIKKLDKKLDFISDPAIIKKNLNELEKENDDLNNKLLSNEIQINLYRSKLNKIQEIKKKEHNTQITKRFYL